MAGRYTFHYERMVRRLPCRLSSDRTFRDWHDSDLDHLGKPVSRGRVVWTGSNRDSDRYGALIRLYLGTWENPRPGKGHPHRLLLDRRRGRSVLCGDHRGRAGRWAGQTR